MFSKFLTVSGEKGLCSYKKTKIKDYDLLKKTDIIFKENISTAYYLKYNTKEKLHRIKRQIYLILKFLKLKK